MKATEIKHARERLRLTQGDFAKQLGTTQQHVSKWENGTPPRRAWNSLLTRFLRNKGIIVK